MIMELNKNSYLNIQAWMITDLNLKGNELLIYAIIYGFSQDEKSVFSGSSGYLCKWTNSTKQSVFKCLKKLCDKGLIDRVEKFINGVTLVDYRVTNVNVVVNKVDGGSKQSLLGGSKQSLLHNIDIDNKEDIIVYNTPNAFESFYTKYHLLSGKPKENKTECLKYYNKLSANEKNLANDNLERWIKSKKDIYKESQYIVKCYKYLRDKLFYDEISQSKIKKNYDTVNPHWA